MGAQLNEEECGKGGKTAEFPFIAAIPLLKTPVSAATGMSTDSGDKLNLRTSQSQDTPSLPDHRDDHNRRSCTCGTPSRSCIAFAISHDLWHGATICSTPRKAVSPSRFPHDLWHEATISSTSQDTFTMSMICGMTPQLHLPANVGNTARGA